VLQPARADDARARHRAPGRTGQPPQSARSPGGCDRSARAAFFTTAARHASARDRSQRLVEGEPSSEPPPACDTRPRRKLAVAIAGSRPPVHRAHLRAPLGEASFARFQRAVVTTTHRQPTPHGPYALPDHGFRLFHSRRTGTSTADPSPSRPPPTPTLLPHLADEQIRPNFRHAHDTPARRRRSPQRSRSRSPRICATTRQERRTRRRVVARRSRPRPPLAASPT
jgi:hypothetical protein